MDEGIAMDMKAWVKRWFPRIAIPAVIEQCEALRISYGNDRRSMFLLFDHLTKLESLVAQEMRSATQQANSATQELPG
jgi:hypothetical protein